MGVSKWQRVTHAFRSGINSLESSREASAPPHERPPAHVTILMRDDSLVATFGHRNDDDVFVDGGERMVLHVVLEAEHLPGPLDYTLEFRRPH
ncbi:MAG TPA: hypothetical protein VNV25_10015 [Gemmatimonadaceae bacterium]|nr:hypothetical protein [Gemmatimonadaceae bacterium]